MARYCLFVVAALTLVACSKDVPPERDAGPSAFQKELQTKFINARPGDLIEIPAGTYELNRGLSLNISGVTVRGAGMDKTILSFRNQVQGAEGLLVNASDFTIEDLAIEDTPGDGLKVNEGRNIVIRRVRTEWTNGPDESNGAYGIYPVQTENVLVEECVAIASSDAGIYVGQSKNIVVRNNRAEFNVAGIEIENSFDADVYGNTVVNNTGGILVFNMPALPQLGHSTRVYGNTRFPTTTPIISAQRGRPSQVCLRDRASLSIRMTESKYSTTISRTTIQRTSSSPATSRPDISAKKSRRRTTTRTPRPFIFTTIASPVAVRRRMVSI